MITNFKIFENNNLEPEVGDYVITSKKIQDHSLYDFFRNNVGKIITISKNFEGELIEPKRPHYYIKMKFDKCFSNLYDPNHDNAYFYGEDTFRSNFSENEIEFFSKNKEDVEAYLASEKYNL